jgi:SAM-dependent methyltransferase
MQKAIPHPALDLIENFPAHEKAAAFLKEIILGQNCKRIADIGGGAYPLLDDDFIAKSGIQYFLVDKSPSELGKANPLYNKIEADAGSDTFRRQIGDRQFDLIFSYMLLEHIANPLQAHRNFHAALKPGGRCVHFYTSPNNLPLAVNRLLPESISAGLLKIAQPNRNAERSRPKFKAYYRMCGAPRAALTAQLEEIGYTVIRHTGYIGHTYYERFGLAAALERRVRRIAHKFRLPLITGCLLVLRKNP